MSAQVLGGKIPWAMIPTEVQEKIANDDELHFRGATITYWDDLSIEDQVAELKEYQFEAEALASTLQEIIKHATP